MAPDEPNDGSNPEQPANKPADRDSDAIAAKKAADEKAADEAKAAKKAEDKKAEAERKAAEKAADAKRDAEDKARREAEELAKPPQAPPWWRTLRAEPPAHMRLLLGAAFIALTIFGWWLLTRGDMVSVRFNGRTNEMTVKVLPSVDRVISAATVPSPGEVFGSIKALLDRDLIDNLVVSLTRVLKGIGLAAFFGIGFGILCAAHRGVNAALMPLVIFLRSIPMGALIPLTLALFGSGEPQKVRFIFIAVVPFVFSDTVKALSIVPDRYVETAQTLGATRFQIIRKVLVPLALPDIITSLRFQFGLALGYITLAEQINPQLGLGMLLESKEGPFPHKYLLLFVIAFVAFGIDLVLRTLQRGSFAWRKDL